MGGRPQTGAINLALSLQSQESKRARELGALIFFRRLHRVRYG
jgi:hypothetical protein